MTNDTTTDEPDESTDDRRNELAAVADRLADRATTIETTDPTADLTDLEPIGDALAGARIVGLGEATHGTREFFRLKHRLVRGLVERQGLRLFAIEANLPETLAMNDYVLHGEGTPEEALDGMYFWTWNTESVVALAEWLRGFNEGRPLDDRVRFHGIDAQYTSGAVGRLDAFLATADPDLRAAVDADLAAADDKGETTEEHMSAHDPDATDRLIERLTTAFDERTPAYAAATSERTTVLARRCLDTIEQARARRVAYESESQEAAMRVREAAMADNVDWLLDRESSDRLALWAHDSHLCRTENHAKRFGAVASLGNRLADRYGEDYYPLGFDFLGGEFRAIGVRLTEDSERATWSLDEPPADSVTRAFAAIGAELAFLDFGTLDAQERAWFDEPRAKRELGAVYYGSDGPADDAADGQATHNEWRSLTEAFDGLVFVRETTATRPPE
ncbi:erythromycin esterase family protein [Halococcus salifodinae]|uniref:Erythromycin esterase-like protein n=1 Tax=Halococcus salifodinae DSM 8989 TaxID=1227456 RepID=M0N934_9EURY|nr:erythromycin esterase family protein [Halococcus salifodinae]EMA53160.1 erythromycin esterase-like protein [Halococcus salifodinae DSM 8989]